MDSNKAPFAPPSEASSLLLRVNRNCPWNRCTFCSIYKKSKFSIRSVEDVIHNIDSIYDFIVRLQDPNTTPAALQRNLSTG